MKLTFAHAETVLEMTAANERSLVVLPGLWFALGVLRRHRELRESAEGATDFAQPSASALKADA